MRHEAVQTFLVSTKVKNAWKFTSTLWYTGAGKRLIFTPPVVVEVTKFVKQRQKSQLIEEFRRGVPITYKNES